MDLGDRTQVYTFLSWALDRCMDRMRENNLVEVSKMLDTITIVLRGHIRRS